MQKACKKHLQRPPLCRGFKALKQVVTLHYKLNQPDKMMEAYRCTRQHPQPPPGHTPPVAPAFAWQAGAGRGGKGCIGGAAPRDRWRRTASTPHPHKPTPPRRGPPFNIDIAGRC